MTYQGAVDELKSLENNEFMPDWSKPTIKKVRETMEMDGRENIHGEWIDKDGVSDYFYCSKCDYKEHYSRCSYFCPNCGATMKGNT